MPRVINAATREKMRQSDMNKEGPSKTLTREMVRILAANMGTCDQKSHMFLRGREASYAHDEVLLGGSRSHGI